MKTVKVPVQDQSEGDNILRALADPECRAFVNIVGALLPFGAGARLRILNWVAEVNDERAQSPALPLEP